MFSSLRFAFWLFLSAAFAALPARAQTPVTVTSPHAVLLDLTMPQMSGEEVYQSLLRHDPDARVVIMSGYSADDIRARFPAGARLGFLQKPFTPAALDQALREIARA